MRRAFDIPGLAASVATVLAPSARSRRTWFSLLFLFGTLALMETVEAVQPFTPAFTNPITEPYRWHLINDLSGKGCRCMVEDCNGVVWFGINGGVLSYDGVQWQSHILQNKWQNDPVVALCATSDGTLYAGTPNGVSRYRNGAWQDLDISLGFADTLDYPNNKYPIIELPDHSVMIGTRQGLLRVQDDQMSLYRLEGRYKSLSAGFHNESVHALPILFVYSLYWEAPEKLWVGLNDGTVYYLLTSELSATPKWHKVDDQPGFRLGQFPKIGKNGNFIYIVNQESHRGVNIFDGRRWHEFDLGGRFGIDNVHSDLLSTRDGTLWIGGLEHLYALKDGQWYIYDSAELPIPANRLFLYETRDGSLWIGGLGSEMWRIDLATPRWTSFRQLNYQGETPQKEKWFLARDGKIVTCDSAMQHWQSFAVSDGLMDTPTAVLVTRDGRIWSAGSHNSVAATAWFDGQGWHRQLHPRLGWGIDYRAIYEARDGSVWFGVSSDPAIVTAQGSVGGLARCRPFAGGAGQGQFDYYYFNDRFFLYGIYGIGQDDHGDLWIGQLGLYRFAADSNQFHKISAPRALVENFIDCIYTSRTGSLWFGTRSNGLFWHDAQTGQWANFTAENSLSSNTIISIFAESDSNVWVATDQDICHFDGRSWVANVFPAHIKMTSSGGSLSISKDGSLWINHRSRTWNRRTLYPGATLRESREWFRTIRYQPDHQPPKTFISFSQDRISQPGNVLLSWIAHDPWQSTPDQQLQYSYRMDQQPWCDYTSKTSEIFLSVGDGDHTFEVRARDRDMNVDPQPARVSFYVTPPTWKQTWFIALITAFLVTILYFIFHLMHRNKIIKQLSEAKVRLFTNISHEFRTPLTLILGPLQQVQHALRPKDPLQRPLHMMYHNSLRLMRLVDQLLDFQKIEAGQLRLEPGQDDVMGFIRKVASDFEAMARDKHIDFRIETDPDPCLMSFDPDKLEKILYNLLANSFKFTHNEGHILIRALIVTANDGEPAVRQTANSRQEMKKRLVIMVQDDGIGIPGQQLAHIFDRFYQVDDRSHFHRGGTGIGLALVKELVALHNGEIDVQSQVGAGTTFHITLPLVLTDVADAGATQDRKEAVAALATAPVSSSRFLVSHPQESNSKPVILLVEDNADMRHFIRHDLESFYHIIEATNGREAIELAIEPPCDLIISDVMMPEMNGIELCKLLKQDERTSHIPIILLTARSSHMHKIEGLEIGADDYITKPFHTRELEIRIHNLIQSRKLLQERFSRQIKVEPKEIAITPTDEKILRRAIDCLEQHMDDQEYGVDAFSRDMGMSRVGLYNKLKALTNQSVQEFMFNLRLKRAAQLLRDSDLTITEISFQVGFKDSSHFTKLFKKQFGVLPSSFSKTYQQMDNAPRES